MNCLWWRKVDICSGFKVWVWSLWYPNRNWGWFHDGFFYHLDPSLKCIWPSSREAWSSCMKNCRRSRRYSLSPERVSLTSGRQLEEQIPLVQLGGKLIWAQVPIFMASLLEVSFYFKSIGHLTWNPEMTAWASPHWQLLYFFFFFFFNLPAQGECQ